MNRGQGKLRFVEGSGGKKRALIVAGRLLLWKRSVECLRMVEGGAPIRMEVKRVTGSG